MASVLKQKEKIIKTSIKYLKNLIRSDAAAADGNSLFNWNVF